MKSSTLRTGVALACAATLAACGGGNENLALGGQVYGLTKSGLVLENLSNKSTVTVPAGSSTFVFEQLIASDENFEVVIKTQPTGAVCKLNNGKGKSGSYSIYSIEVVCVTNTYNVGGTISGLTTPGLVIINGSTRVDVVANTTTFTLPVKVADGSPYGITILTQPTGQTCAIANGTGTMGSTDINNVAITCQ
jgi:RNase P/RNase MRP subunit p29